MSERLSPDVGRELPRGERVVWVHPSGAFVAAGRVVSLCGDVYLLDLDHGQGLVEVHRLRVVAESGYAAWYASLTN